MFNVGINLKSVSLILPSNHWRRMTSLITRISAPERGSFRHCSHRFSKVYFHSPVHQHQLQQENLLNISIIREYIFNPVFIMPAIASLEYFRVPPRWLFVKITDEEGKVGWGEASLEGHSQAVEGCLDAYRDRILGLNAECVFRILSPSNVTASSYMLISFMWQ